MFTIMGVTGNVGGEVARRLWTHGKTCVRLYRTGCDVAQADINDTAGLAAAFAGAEGVFVMVPPNFDPLPGFPEAQAIAASVFAAIEKARPERVVYLSTIGAQTQQSNLLSQHTMIEGVLRECPVPIAFLRPGWFMENSAWDVVPARDRGVIPSFLQPLDKPVPMVATADIGRVAAELLPETWTGSRVVELEGPHRVTPNDIAATFSELLARSVRMDIVPRETWETLFRSQGMKNPTPRIRMLDGLNEGWIEFEGGVAGSLKGSVALRTVLAGLIEREAS